MKRFAIGTKHVRRFLLVTALLVASGSAFVAASAADSTAEKTFGRTNPGSTFGFPGADYKYGSRYTLPENGSVTSVVALMRGRLAGSATAGKAQRFRTMIYAADGPGGDPGTLLATSRELVLADNAPEGVYRFPFAAPVALPAGSYWLMQQAGADGAQAGISEDTIAPGNQRFNSDLYADGPSNPAGPVTAQPKVVTSSPRRTRPPPADPAEPGRASSLSATNQVRRHEQ